jgi:5-enolpyruvylshikimate-3-phosphate synthase
MMKTVTVYPGKASGIISAPPSIDEKLRAIILAALTKTSIWQTCSCCETEDIYNTLFEMGARFRQQDEMVTFYAPPKKSTATIKCNLSTFYLILPLCAVLGGEYRFTSEYDSEAVKTLSGMGIECWRDKGGITVCGKLNTESIELCDKMLLEGFLLCLPLMKDGMLHCNGLDGGAELTLSIMRGFGYTVSENGGYCIKKDRYVNDDFSFRVSGDYSKAVYLMLFGFFGGEVGVMGLLADSTQPQKKILDELKALKLGVAEYSGAVFAKKSRAVSGFLDISKSVEPAAVLALCCFGKGECTIRNKEAIEPQKRLDFDIVLAGLKDLGADISEIGSDILVSGRRTILGGRADAIGSEKASLVFAAAALLSETSARICNAAGLEFLPALGVSSI